MAYNAAYYEQKRIDITNRLVKKMENTITSVSQLLNQFYEDKTDLVAQLQEVVKTQQENTRKEGGESVQEAAKDPEAKNKK